MLPVFSKMKTDIWVSQEGDPETFSHGSRLFIASGSCSTVSTATTISLMPWALEIGHWLVHEDSWGKGWKRHRAFSKNLESFLSFFMYLIPISVQEKKSLFRRPESRFSQAHPPEIRSRALTDKYAWQNPGSECKDAPVWSCEAV